MAFPQPKIMFGQFQWLCQHTSLTSCNLFPQTLTDCSQSSLAIPDSTFRIYDIGDGILTFVSFFLIYYLFYKATLRFAAVGRREMIIFLLFCSLEFACHFLTTTKIISNHTALTIATAVEMGLIAASSWSLFLNGFVGFQCVEDGSFVSVYGNLLSSLAVGGATGYIAVDTSMSLTGAFKYNIVTLYAPVTFSLYTILPLACFLGYLITQTVLVITALGTRKPLIFLFLSTFCYVASCISIIYFSGALCMVSKGYLSSNMFSTFFTLLFIGFVYKFWVSITEDVWDDYDGLTL